MPTKKPSLPSPQQRRHPAIVPVMICCLLLAVVVAWPGNPLSSMASSIRFPGAPGGGWFIVVAGGDLWETDGGSLLQLTHVGKLSQPAWTNRGLVYLERQKNHSDLWLIDAAQKPMRLTQNSATIVEQNHWVAQPVAALGGDQLYLLSDHDKASTGVGDLALWSLDLRQKTFRQITHPQEYTGGDQDLTINPRQPNEVVFSRYGYAADGQLTEQIVWLDLTAKATVPLLPADHSSRQAAYAPDGAHIAFIQSDGPQEVLWVGQLQVAQGKPKLNNLQQVADGVNAQPVWSADGSTLGYLSLHDRQFQLWTRSITTRPDGPLDFGSAVQITHGPSLDATSRPLSVSVDVAAQIRAWLQSASPIKE